MRNDRFATDREIKDHLKKLSESEGGGPVLWVDPETKEVYVLNSESNLIFLGVSGAGKTRRGIISMIRTWIMKKECFIVVDPKGDLYYLTYCFAKEAGYLLYVLNLRDLKNSDGVNTFMVPYCNYLKGNIEQANNDIQTQSHALIKHNPHTDVFWPDSARSLFEAVAIMLMKLGKPDQINILSVISMINAGVERMGVKKVFDIICDEHPDSIESLLLHNVRKAPNDTLGSILSSTFEPLNVFIKSPALVEMLTSDDLSIGSLDVQQPTGIYIITPDENSNYSAVASILVSQIANHYIQLAHEKYNGRLPRRVNICIEELGNLGENGIPNLDHLMSAGRSRNIRTSIVLQSFSQLDQNYGKSTAETIISNADTIIAYRTNQWETLEELSRKCGEHAIDYGNRVNVERVISPSQIGAMETGRVLVLASGRLKYSTVLPDFTEIFPTENWYPPKPGKHKRKEAKIFDLKAEAEKIMKRMAEERLKSTDNLFDRPFLPFSNGPFTSGISEKQEEQAKKALLSHAETAKTNIKEEMAFFNKNNIESGNTYYRVNVAADWSRKECADIYRDINKIRVTKAEVTNLFAISVFFTRHADAINFVEKVKKHVIDIECLVCSRDEPFF